MTNPPKHRKRRVGQVVHSAIIFVVVAFIMLAFLAALYGPDYFREP